MLMGAPQYSYSSTKLHPRTQKLKRIYFSSVQSPTVLAVLVPVQPTATRLCLHLSRRIIGGYRSYTYLNGPVILRARAEREGGKESNTIPRLAKIRFY